MQHLIKSIVFTIFMVMILCCSDQGNNPSTMGIQPLENFKKKIHIEDIFTTHDSIRLNTNNTFGSITKILPMDKNYVILTKNPSSLIKIDENGNEIKLLTVSVDETEVLRGITDFGILNGITTALIREQSKIIKLDYDLNILSTKSIPFFAQSILSLPNNKYMFYCGNELTEFNNSSVIYYDANNESILDQNFKINPKKRQYFNFQTNSNFIRSHEKIYFWDGSFDCIYEVTENFIFNKSLCLDFQAYKLEDNFWRDAEFANAYEFMTSMRKSDKAFRYFNPIITDEIFFTYINVGNELRQSFTDLNNDFKSLNTSDVLITVNDEIIQVSPDDYRFYINSINEDIVVYIPNESKDARSEFGGNLYFFRPIL